MRYARDSAENAGAENCSSLKDFLSSYTNLGVTEIKLTDVKSCNLAR